jgi:hypothetical protein
LLDLHEGVRPQTSVARGCPLQRADPASSQSPPNAVETPPGLARLGADVLANRHVALDDRVPQDAEALDLDLDDVARLDRAVRGFPTESRRRG